LGIKTYTLKNRDDVSKLLADKTKNIKLIIIDIDRAGSEPMSFIQGVTRSNPELKILAASVDHKRWSALFRAVKGVEVADKPIGVWAIHSIVKEVSKLDKPLVSKVEKLSELDQNGTESKSGNLRPKLQKSKVINSESKDKI
ncbi:MAG: hypothetical protein KDD56_10120, partial [Bdellovibrionales bacterium]|nr:hypothetical protein [Bdellovibrionales bacterium]